MKGKDGFRYVGHFKGLSWCFWNFGFFFFEKKKSQFKKGGVAQGYGRYTLSNSEYVIYGEFASGSLIDSFYF